MPYLGQSGQTLIDPRAAMLQQQALRQEPILDPVGLVGRLALFGVGAKRQRSFEEEIASARLKYAEALQSAGTDPSARIAALGVGIASPDPATRQAAQEALFEATKPGGQVIGTPGGGSVWLGTMGGQPTGAPQPLVQGRAAAPNVFEVKDGENLKTFAFDPNTGTMVDLATAPRETLQRILPPDVFKQQAELRRVSGEAQGAATGAALAKVAQVGAETTARAQATADVKLKEAQAAQGRYKAQALQVLGKIEQAIADAGMTGGLNPSARDKLEGLRTAAAVAMARAASESPEQEPNANIIDGFKAMLPTAGKGAVGITGGLDAAYALMGGRPEAAQQVPQQAPTGADPKAIAAKLRRAAELMEKAGAP